jgi:hypothetical protein
MDPLEIAVTVAGFLISVGLVLYFVLRWKPRNPGWEITEDNWDPKSAREAERTPVDLPEVPAEAPRATQPTGVERSVDHYLNEMSQRSKEEREKVL